MIKKTKKFMCKIKILKIKNKNKILNLNLIQNYKIINFTNKIISLNKIMKNTIFFNRKKSLFYKIEIIQKILQILKLDIFNKIKIEIYKFSQKK